MRRLPKLLWVIFNGNRGVATVNCRESMFVQNGLLLTFPAYPVFPYQNPGDSNFNVCMMPTKDQIEQIPGTPLTKEEIAKLQAEGQLPPGLDPSVGAPTLHRIKQGDQEILV
ncbi:unnamed protein product, partial [Strongylus vulgaris]